MKTKQFNSLGEIANSLEANEITIQQAIEITKAGLKHPVIIFQSPNGKMNVSVKTVVKNLREFDVKIKNCESRILFINLEN
jgi:hypothetical protein